MNCHTMHISWGGTLKVWAHYSSGPRWGGGFHPFFWFGDVQTAFIVSLLFGDWIFGSQIRYDGPNHMGLKNQWFTLMKVVNFVYGLFLHVQHFSILMYIYREFTTLQIKFLLTKMYIFADVPIIFSIFFLEVIEGLDGNIEAFDDHKQSSDSFFIM